MIRNVSSHYSFSNQNLLWLVWCVVIGASDNNIIDIFTCIESKASFTHILAYEEIEKIFYVLPECISSNQGNYQCEFLYDPCFEQSVEFSYILIFFHKCF